MENYLFDFVGKLLLALQADLIPELMKYHYREVLTQFRVLCMLFCFPWYYILEVRGKKVRG